MNETIRINILLLASPFLIAIGIAISISLLSLMEFYRKTQKISRKDFTKTKLFVTGIRTGLIFILLGYLLFLFKIPSDKLIVPKLNRLTLENLKPWPTNETKIQFLPNDLIIDPHNKSHVMNNKEMKENTISLFWDGFIQTPYLVFQKGFYSFNFTAKGSNAEHEFSKIKVEFESQDKKNYLVTESTRYFELSGEMKTYSFLFSTNKTTTGRIRITYFNDLYLPETKQGRDTWVKDILMIKNE